MTSIAEIIDGIIQAEGGYVNDPNDAGGETKFGITIRVARENGYSGDMSELPLALAQKIYLRKYVQEPKFDQVVAASSKIATELVDTGVNMGVGKSAEFFQQALNSFNRQGKDYPDVLEDGQIGVRTLTAFNTFMAKRGQLGETVMLRALNALQGARYIELGRLRSANEEFTFGWFANRVEVEGD